MQTVKQLTELYIRVSRRRTNVNEPLTTHLREALLIAQAELSSSAKRQYEIWHLKKFRFDW